MSDEIVVQTRAISKVYRDFWGRQKVRALKALDLEVRRGEADGHPAEPRVRYLP